MLTRDLDEVMDSVALVATRLDGARNPAEAIKRGVTDVWQELTRLRDRYDRLRQAQDWVMADHAQITDAPTTYARDDDAPNPVLSNFDEILTHLRTPVQPHALHDWETSRVHLRPEDPIAQLIRFATSRGQLNDQWFNGIHAYQRSD
ncbi:hypothetical protein NJB14197_27150 [Mycobacterium montefiorense]|uniref:Uncharacterized protein n=2 Tax=Mycobacterium montefiorense TaxID=154654 RepID=A0AA37UUL1_9MYCO|nr:hypothetical protein MmonteBS_22560 [Mycobacterium montefiorense]GKU35022.1 hypothetical protein NJB14191_23680 [Mycobacterium montefiorense]GKU41033.1 hypothetical protein NJB14192_30190 [Mycobacterium montefiorense]GKU47144.1 hypothetical protein NJB14194_37620 [Mycobacterium montefiorense]GKU49264.1 hypothetical protein NJB14195_05110 [Mycobacterium montefiorense]